VHTLTAQSDAGGAGGVTPLLEGVVGELASPWWYLRSSSALPWRTLLLRMLRFMLTIVFVTYIGSPLLGGCVAATVVPVALS
jgi:hypothetical protein